MRTSSGLWYGIVLAGLWVVVALVVWLMAVQAFLLMSPFGKWQRPGIASVTVLEVYRDPQNNFTDSVIVLREGRKRTLTMLKKEAAELEPLDQIWVLDNYFYTPIRPPQFRLSPARLLLEYPQPLLLLALLAIQRLRAAAARAARARQEAVPAIPRTVLRDDFHARAQRFAASKPMAPPPEETPEP